MRSLYTFIGTVTLLGLSFNSQAQTADTTKCFDYYKQLFAQKGTYDVREGNHEVIITVRQGDSCGVTYGRVKVVGGKLVRPLYIKDGRGNYVRSSKKLSDKYELYRIPLEFDILNGMSATTYITQDNDLVDIFLIDILKK